MDAMDTDMAETGIGGGGGPAGGEVPADGSPWSLLALARQYIDQGKPSLALQAVVVAMKSQGGEHAVLQTLSRASELYKSRLQTDAASEELASLFAECAITEAQPLTSGQLPPRVRAPTMLADINGDSILALSGRRQVVLDAFADGSSFICLQCGGLVSNSRKDEHLALWCGKV